MFSRRNRRPLLSRLRGALWPATGWRRAWRYLAHRIARLPGTPYTIAAGFACGAAISFTPFLGLHFALSALSAWIIRANVVAAAVGTVVGNPWTFPLIWYWIYHCGIWMMGETARHRLPEHLTFGYVVGHPWDIFLPMTLGSLPNAVLAWLVFFYPLRGFIAVYQRDRVERRRRGRAVGLGQ